VKTDLNPIHSVEVLYGYAIMFEVPITVETHVAKRVDHGIPVS
jgi:hypothetical protein